MRKTLVPAAVLALFVMTAPTALAQDGPVDCAAAVTALNAADVAHRDAVAADEKHAAGKEADDELVRAENRLAKAQAELDAAIAADNAAGATEDSPATVSAKALVATRTDEVNRARVEADKTDADELRRKANRTDAAALKTALDEAREDFDRICGGVTTTPAPELEDPRNTFNCIDFPLNDGRTAQDVLAADLSDPHNLDTDNDGVACESDQPSDSGLGNDDPAPTTVPAPVENVTVPSGGVATGGGPA